MKRALIAIASLLILMSSAALSGESDDMRAFRAAYQHSENLFGPAASRDFQEANTRIGDLLNRLVSEGELTEEGRAELGSFIDELEREYTIRWFGEPEFQHADQQRNAGYDSQFREQTRQSSKPTM